MSSALELPRSAAIASRLLVVEQSASTNTELIERASADAAGWPHLSVLVTDAQTAGKGRLGRSWQAPAGTSLAISLLLRPRMPIGAYGWLPLIAGVAMARAVREAGATAAVVKWPNDVLIEGRKVSGILAELLTDASGVVVGAGVNLTIARADLPVETATSLLLEGVVEPSADGVLAAYLGQMRELYERLAAADGDAEASGIREAVAAECDTIGREVRVELPGGEVRLARASGIDELGRLIVEADGESSAISAGDVTHLRY